MKATQAEAIASIRKAHATAVLRLEHLHPEIQNALAEQLEQAKQQSIDWVQTHPERFTRS